MAEERKPYASPKLRKLDPRCVAASFKVGITPPLDEPEGGRSPIMHVTNCKCDR